MTDLTKNEKAFGFLDVATQEAFRNHKGPIQRYRHKGWCDLLARPLWLPSHIYRAKPGPLTKPSPPWDVIADWVNFVFREERGTIWGCDHGPFNHGVGWGSHGNVELLSGVIKIDPGTCDWRDSLVRRPIEGG